MAVVDRLPRSYLEFLENEDTYHINGLPLFVPGEDGPMEDMLGLLEAMRPDLPSRYIPIRLLDTRFLCLCLTDEKKTLEDASLVEIDLAVTDPPRKVHPSFKKYYDDSKEFERRRDGAFRRIKWHLESAKRQRKLYGHKNGGYLPRNKDWRTIRSCVHDLVVGLATIRHDEEFNGLDVDVFLCTDHPSYEAGYGIRALTLLLLSDAYRNGATMAMRFARYSAKEGKRVAERIPRELLQLATGLGVDLKKVYEGVVSHEESLELYSALVGLSPAVRKNIQPHVGRGTFSLPGLCFLISARIWSLEETSWILLNDPRPEGVLFGEDKPEDRLYYMASVQHGRAALLASHLRQRLMLNADESGGECFVEIDGPKWLYRPTQPVTVDWTASSKSVRFGAGEVIAVYPNPHRPLPQETKRIVEDVKRLYGLKKVEKENIVLYSAEFGNVPNIKKIVEEILKKTGILLLISPFSCNELDEEVKRRMTRARLVRR